MSHNPFGWTDDDDELIASVELVQLPLFYTTDWKVVIKVGGFVKWESTPEPNKPSEDEIREWVAMMIVNNYTAFKLMNVNLAALYKSVGGNPHEIMIY